MGQPAFRIVDESTEVEMNRPVPVHVGTPPDISLIGRIKVRVLAMVLLSPWWWFGWSLDEDRRPWAVFFSILLTLVPLVHKMLRGNNARRTEKVLDGVFSLMIVLIMKTDMLTAAALCFALVASPEDSLFMVPVTIFFRVALAPMFAAIALYSSSFKELRWYQVAVRSFEVGAHAGYDLAHQTHNNVVSNWFERYGKRLFQLVKKS